MDTPRTAKSLTPLLAGLLIAAPPLHAQIAEDPDTLRFERRYLDASAYRSERVLLHDWPALTRLVRWSSRVETALSEENATLSADLLAEFRARADSLFATSVPKFLETEADSARAHLAAIDSLLERAESSLAALPSPTVSGEESPNVTGRQRTLVTGRTAVTVPAGVEVGEGDSLPTAELPEEELNFTDYIALALTELDGLVHLVREVGRALGETGEEATGTGPTSRRVAEPPNPPPGKGPDRPGR